jgi:hypothetical protein
MSFQIYRKASAEKQNPTHTKSSSEQASNSSQLHLFFIKSLVLLNHFDKEFQYAMNDN